MAKTKAHFSPPTSKQQAAAVAYLESLAKEPLTALIIGIDPYPTKANGIAFSKDEPLSEASSGYKLFKWLARDCDPSDAGTTAMYTLLDVFKFGFVNLSRSGLIKELGSQKKAMLARDAKKNCALAKKAGAVIFIGRTICNARYLREQYASAIQNGNCYSIPHPAARRGEWNKFLAAWNKPDKAHTNLAKRLGEATKGNNSLIRKISSVEERE